MNTTTQFPKRRSQSAGLSSPYPSSQHNQRPKSADQEWVMKPAKSSDRQSADKPAASFVRPTWLARVRRVLGRLRTPNTLAASVPWRSRWASAGRSPLHRELPEPINLHPLPARILPMILRRRPDPLRVRMILRRRPGPLRVRMIPRRRHRPNTPPTTSLGRPSSTERTFVFIEDRDDRRIGRDRG